MINNEIKIKHVASVHVGYQARGKLIESTHGEFIILRTQDFDLFGRLNVENARRFVANDEIDPRRYLVEKDDILIQARGQKQQAFYIGQYLDDAVASNAFYIIRIKDKSRINPEYLAWWINQSVVQKYFEQRQGISTIPFIAMNVVVDAPVVIPEIETQNTICELVNCWQEEHGLFLRLISSKEKLIQAAAMSAVKSTQEVK